jgi:hypothetical protein
VRSSLPWTGLRRTPSNQLIVANWREIIPLSDCSSATSAS